MPFFPETFGGALSRQQDEGGAQLLARRLRLFRAVLESLAWLHQAGVTHRGAMPRVA